ncbi:hypothetical protein J6590_025643 [Homalodisca vitripennis]|nr:hypothetical protein J6590_025643 [Homalodisca vitripennis]
MFANVRSSITLRCLATTDAERTLQLTDDALCSALCTDIINGRWLTSVTNARVSLNQKHQQVRTGNGYPEVVQVDTGCVVRPGSPRRWVSEPRAVLQTAVIQAITS